MKNNHGCAEKCWIRFKWVQILTASLPCLFNTVIHKPCGGHDYPLSAYEGNQLFVQNQHTKSNIERKTPPNLFTLDGFWLFLSTESRPFFKIMAPAYLQRFSSALTIPWRSSNSYYNYLLSYSTSHVLFVTFRPCRIKPSLAILFVRSTVFVLWLTFAIVYYSLSAL